MRRLILIAATAALGACEYQESGQPAANTTAPAAEPPPTVNAAADAPPPGEVPLARAATDPALKWGPCPAPFPTGCELAVLHGDPAKPNADVLLRMPGGYIIPPHRHSSAERMMLVTGQLEVKYRGTPAATLQPGSYAYGPANAAHRATCTGSAQCHLFVAFEGPVDIVAVEGGLE